jgi:hypothetical protein
VIDIPARALFLGQQFEAGTPKRNGGPLLLEAAGVTTRRVVAAMTGSEKRITARSATLMPVG